MTSLRTGTDLADPMCTALHSNFRPPLPLGHRKVTSFTQETP